MKRKYLRHVCLLGMGFLLALIMYSPSWFIVFMNDVSTEIKLGLVSTLIGSTLVYYIVLLVFVHIPKFFCTIVKSPKKQSTPRRRTYVIACLVLLLLVSAKHYNETVQRGMDLQVIKLLENPPEGLETIVTLDKFELPDDLTPYGVLTPLMIRTQAAVQSFDIAIDEYDEARETLVEKLTLLENVILEVTDNGQPLAEFLDAQKKLNNYIVAAEVVFDTFPQEIRRLNLSDTLQSELLERYELTGKVSKAFVFSILQNESQQLQITGELIELSIKHAENMIFWDSDFKFLDEETQHEHDVLVAQLNVLEEEAHNKVIAYVEWLEKVGS